MSAKVVDSQAVERDKAAADDPAWGHSTRGEPRWPASLAVVGAVVLFIMLPAKLALPTGKEWSWLQYIFVPALELLLIVPLSIAAPRRRPNEPRWQRYAAIALIAVVNVINVVSLSLLVYALLHHEHIDPHVRALEPKDILLAALDIWLTNVLVFALWYWELDRGGPDDRAHSRHRQPDFLFPQMTTPHCTYPHWTPGFVDYLYVSFTNATAFSPTDTMPLTPWAKMLMLIQSLASLLTVALVAARAVNILQ